MFFQEVVCYIQITDGSCQSGTGSNFYKKTTMQYNGTKIICLILTGRVKKASKVTYKLMTEAKKNSKRGKTYQADRSFGHGNCGSNCNQETDTSFLGWVPLHWNYVASENSKVYSMIQMYRYCRNFVWECVVFGSLWSWQVILVAGFRFFLARPRLIYF